MITFSIFFLVPRLAGASAETLASRYVGRTASSQDSSRRRREARLLRPDLCPVWTLGQGDLRRCRLRLRPGRRALPRAVLRVLVPQECNPVWPDLIDRLNGHRCRSSSAPPLIWLIAGVATGIISALRRGVDLRPRSRWGSRWRACHCRSSSPACVADRLQLRPPVPDNRPGRSFTDFTTNPREWAYNLILPWITLGLPVRGRVRPTDPGGHAGDHERGLRAHRAGQGPDRAGSGRSSTACAPRSLRS